MSGDIELLADDPAAAETVLEAACDALASAHDQNSLATRAADLAEALYRQGKLERADHWAATSEAKAAADDLRAQPQWRSVRAKLLARSRAFVEAEALAREAVRLARNNASHVADHEFRAADVGLLLAAIPTLIEQVHELKSFLATPAGFGSRFL